MDFLHGCLKDKHYRKQSAVVDAKMAFSSCKIVGISLVIKTLDLDPDPQ